MATTAKGTPYVESSDLVANYPAVSLALAEHIDDFGGKVLQVVSDPFTGTFTSSSSTFTAVTGLAVTITPTAATSKILILLSMSYGVNYAATQMGVSLYRDSTPIMQGNSAGSRNQASAVFFQYGNNNYSSYGHISFLDSPATTSATTYQPYIRSESGAIYVNRSYSDPDLSTYGYRTASSITVMEISA